MPKNQRLSLAWLPDDLGDVLHRNRYQLALRAPPLEHRTTCIGIPQPNTGDKVRSDIFKCAEVPVASKQTPHVLLCIAPNAIATTIQQATNQLWNQVVCRLYGHDGIKDDGICAAITRKHKPVVVTVAERKVCSPCCLCN